MTESDPKAKILKLASSAGVISTRDVRDLGVHPEYIRRLCAQGELVREGYGLYRLADGDLTEHHDLAVVAKAVPRGVVCLISALQFHVIGTQLAHMVWLAIDRRDARPRVEWPPLELVRFSGKALTEGVERRMLEGVPVRIYSPAKTVADCFKYRNKTGLDVAIEALRDVLHGRRATVDELWHYAGVCRVRNVIRPYMEAML